MATLSFYARGDSSTANNASLNVENPNQQPTTLITFDSGPTGDLVLDGNGGNVDPDTQVIIDGVSYDFVVEQTGELEIGNGKIPTALQGKEIAVISVIIDGEYQRFFFVTDGSGTMSLMDSFGNGGSALANLNTNPTEVYICFCTGTDILTSQGYRKVEDLCKGDLVRIASGDLVPIRWIGNSPTSLADRLRDPNRRPIRIAKSAIAPGVPHADLFVSAQHRVVFRGYWCELLFGEPQVLVIARHLLDGIADWADPEEEISYFHILLDEHWVLTSNGLLTESFQPALRSYNGISDGMRNSLADAVPKMELLTMFNRPDALRTLKHNEAQALLEKIAQPRKSAQRFFETIHAVA